MIKSRFFWILSAILVVGFLVIIIYREDNAKISPSFKTSTMHELHLTHKEGGKVKWELSAQKAIFPIGGEKVFLESLGVEINHSPKIYLTSSNGIYEIDKGNVTLNNPVELKVKDTKFTTNTLKWNSADELITTDDAIKFSGKNFSIEGTGLTAKIKQQKIRIIKNVKAIFYR